MGNKYSTEKFRNKGTFLILLAKLRLSRKSEIGREDFITKLNGRPILIKLRDKLQYVGSTHIRKIGAYYRSENYSLVFIWGMLGFLLYPKKFLEKFLKIWR